MKHSINGSSKYNICYTALRIHPKLPQACRQMPAIHFTALQYIHDHLINATGSQKISCLCLLDLSAAFDTTDHSILITRLSSWFGIHGSVLNWFKSYMSSLSFRVKCDNHVSSPHTCSCGVPQGSVLGPLLFIMYTTP